MKNPKNYFEKIKVSSILFQKSDGNSPYLFTDLLFDLIYFIKKGRKDLIFILIFSLIFSIFTLFSFLFLIFYSLSLIYILIKILFALIFNLDKTISLSTYSDDYPLLFNLILSPYYWAKVTIYSIFCWKKKKINLEILEQMLLSKIIGYPFWVIKNSFIWSQVLIDIFKNKSFHRKSIKIWHKVFIEIFKSKFNSIIMKKLAFEHEFHKKNKITVLERKISANQAGLVDFFKTYSQALNNINKYKPYIIELSGVFHQAIKTPEGSFFVFTSKPEIKGFDPFLKKEFLVDTKQLWLGNFNQYYSRSMIDLKEIKHKEGEYLDSFKKNNKLNSLEDLAGFYVRLGFINNFEEFDYFFIQSKNSSIYYHFPNDTYIYNKYLEKAISEAQLKLFLFGRPKGINIPEVFNSVFRAAKSQMDADISARKIDKELIAKGLGEMYESSNQVLLGDLQKIDSELTRSLKTYLKELFDNE